uniref:Uncharacterized protein n=1 Tax=Tetranychus urticae TaxID=32264 RepID=T1KES4_TETUR
MENLNKLVLWYLVKPQKKRKDENDDEQDEDELVASEDDKNKKNVYNISSEDGYFFHDE